MKNLFKITLALILVMTVLAFMFACGKDDVTEGGDTTESTESVSDSDSVSDSTGGDDSSSSEESKISQNDKIPGDANEDLGYDTNWSENA